VSEKYCFGGGLGEACQFIRSANSWMLGHIITMALSGGYIPSEIVSFLWWEFANSVQKQILLLALPQLWEYFCINNQVSPPP